ncbi:hypothetical protein NIES4072_68790 [Nostoc commune NIES-4072]|uniref:Uncharacterized protein n=1 Tax=Nostoc commune NIES-4072 TaxID=2005467 RepID=A0A2R5FWQ2_NOSCO|nr:hypothetical protein [Nostoc commune]BBD70511.1 hypothetical protein NIES4070_69220 [Nostoc commune HK-02]GBG23167.1 hypothetical protein NIES4072_68790 [Nostoc commune NIES-4072]
MNNEPTINQNLDTDDSNNYQSGSGYQSGGYGVEQLSSGDSSNPLQTDQFRDGYQENIFEINLGDTPYTESAANPNPQLSGYGSGSGYKSKKNQQSASPELEL